MAELSVVIPSVNSIEDLRGCLDALLLNKDVSLEVVVVDRLGEQVRHWVETDYPGTVLIRVPHDTTIPEMRAKAFEVVTSDAVAVIEDHVLVPDDWARRLLDALEAGADVAAGPIENSAVDTQVDWAAFLCEYSACLPPLEGGESDWLPGNNTVYRRSLLEKYKPVIDQHKWENALHDAMKADGIKLIVLPDLVVGHKMHYTFGLYLSQRYHYARSYAGARVKGESLPKRLATGAAAFALPPLLLYRTVSRIRSKGRHLEKLGPSIPMLMAFVTSWGMGEVVGYWFGPGKSLAKVR